jgi:transposase-like protein
MATVTNKRKVLSVEEKVKVIREIESGKKKADVCREFGLFNSTVQTI